MIPAEKLCRRTYISECVATVENRRRCEVNEMCPSVTVIDKSSVTAEKNMVQR